MDAPGPSLATARPSHLPTWLGALLIALVGAAIIGIGVLVPFNSVWPDPDPETTATMVGLAFATSIWLVAAVVAYAANRRGSMWALIFAYVAAEWLWVVGWIGNSITWTIADMLGNAAAGVVFVHVLVAFPTGRIRSKSERLFVGFVYAFGFATGLIKELTYQTNFSCDPVCITNVLGLWDAPGINHAFDIVNAVGIPIIGLVAAAIVVRHWRSGGPIARRSLLPVVAALPFAYVVKVGAYVGDNLGIDALSSAARHPIAVILDVILPLGLVYGIGRASVGRGRLADLLRELGQGVPLGGLERVLSRTLGDPSLRIGYPASGEHDLVDGEGRRYVAPAARSTRAVARIDRDGKLLAIIEYDPAVETESPGLVEAIGSATRLTLENERLAAEVRAQLEEVRASRARIAQAADEERRKVERDLHDGAQQRLVALTMRLEQARATAADSSRRIDDTTAELRAAIAEVRRLARGMHPPILTEAGLAAAVDSLAELTPVPVTVRVVDRRFPPSIEAAAYYVVAEALTNVGRYAGATGVTITGTADDGWLKVIVTDDGRGGADPDRGSGLRGLADRVAAVGGSFGVESPAGGGTRILAAFPIS